MIVTNDIFTKEDGEFLVKHGALPEQRIRAVETGGCPHAAIREDISINLGPLEELSNLYKTDILLCESGGESGLVINKTDIAQAIGADLKIMERDALRMRDGGPFVFAQVH
ncbi:hypothetical protein BHM03_00024753 [Ensete ventricosum]|nr:hypothetical protein BHM03_00024753 [Ensete ventricosum]